MDGRRIKRISGVLFCVGICCLLVSSSAFALDFTLGDGISGNFNSTIGMGFGLRLLNPSAQLTNNPQWTAGDDGDLNYHAGQFYSAYIKGTHELLVNMPDDWKFFARGTWKYDFMAGNTDRTPLAPDAQEQIVLNAELLDAWVSKDFNVCDQNGRIRVGNQVISWGEALFLIGGISNNVLDFQKLSVPGTQLKEAFLPVPGVSIATSLPSNMTAEVYIVGDWRRDRVAPVGSYFSASDLYDKGISTGLVGTFPKGFPGPVDNIPATDILLRPDRVPQDWDFKEGGVSLHWTPPSSNVNFGLFFENYHDQFPVLHLVNGSLFQWDFLENRQMYGLTANFPVGNWAVGVEYSYRPHDAVDLSANLNPATATHVFADLPEYADFQKHQWSITGMYALTPGNNGAILNFLHADTAYLTTETAVTLYPGASNGVTRLIDGVLVHQIVDAGYFVTNASTPGGALGTSPMGTDASWGGVLDFNWTYDGTVIPHFQVTPGITFSPCFLGDTPNYATQFLQGNLAINYYILFNQNPTKWQFGINYAGWYKAPWQPGGPAVRQYYLDRDFIGAFVAYNF